MCMDCHNFSNSRGHHFVGNLFVAFQYKTINYFLKVLRGSKFVGRSNPQNPQTLIPNEQ